jgi:hypothetical protein
MRPRTLSLLVCLAAIAAALLHASDAAAQRGKAVSNWFCSCPGGQREVPNSINSPPPDCQRVCFPGGGGSSGGSGARGSGGGGSGLTSLQQMQLNLAGQAGSMLGSMLGQMLFGTPQSNQQAAADQAARAAAERAAEAARLAEIQRALQVEQRRQEEARDRLLVSMRSVGATPDLQIRSVDSGPELQFRLDEALAPRLSELPANSPIAQLTRAAFFSEQAAGAQTDEEAAVLADAAFNSAIGVAVVLPVPPSTQTLRVDDAAVNRIEIARAEYRDAMGRMNALLAGVAEAEQQRAMAQRVLERAQADLETERRGFMRNPAPERKPRVVRAERIADEARKLFNAQQALATARQALVEKAEPVLTQKSQEPLNDPSWWQVAQAVGAYRKGLLDGALCMPSNGGQYCANLGSLRDSCVQRYNSGFIQGERAKEARLREAHSIGMTARASNDSRGGFDHPQSGGTCRVKWLQSFYSGFKGFPFNMAGR